MTGRIFYWNMNTFKQAGIEAVPASYDDLIAAGKAFQEKLGDDTILWPSVSMTA